MLIPSVFRLSWQGYLKFFFLCLGAGLLCSSVITFIAANLDYFSPLQKILGLAGLLFLTTLLAMYCYWRESDSQGVQAIKWRSMVCFFVVAVLIGGLFALVGQTYQTGADAWELFAIWSVCQLPLLIMVPNIASALLFIATSLTAFCLSGSQFSFSTPSVFIYAAGFNLFLLILAEKFNKQLHDQWHILPKVLVIVIAGCLIMSMFNQEHSLLLNSLKLGLAAIALIYVYKQTRFDFIILVISIILLLVALFLFLLQFGDPIVISVILFIATVFAIYQLNQWFKQQYPHLSASPALVLLFILAIITGIAALIFIFANQFGDMHVFFLVMGILCLSIGWGLSKRSDKASSLNFTQILSNLSLLLSYCFLAAYIFDDEMSIISLCLYSLVLIIGYGLHRETWMRTLTLFLLINVWWLYYTQLSVHIGLIDWVCSIETIMLLCLILFYFANASSSNKLRAILLSLGWALLLFYLKIYLISLSHFDRVAVPMNVLIEPYDNSSFFHNMTGNIFRTELNGVLFSHLLVCFAPFISSWFMGKAEPLKRRLGLSAVFICFAISFVGSAYILFMITLCLLAYSLANRTLFFTSIVFLIVYLAEYYYMLSIPLIYKAGLLGVVGVLSLLVTWALSEKTKKQEKRAVVNFRVFNRISSTMLAFILMILAGVGYKVTQFERVLQQGEIIILKIAPQDPRSLMQGDYMRLNYAITSEIIHAFYQDNLALGEHRHKMYALIKLNDQRIAFLCRIEKAMPSKFDDCQADLYLPLGANFRLPSQEYFFAEGKGEYYAQAEYAEYRFKDGILLLANLLDNSLNKL